MIFEFIICIFDTIREFIFYQILVKEFRFSKLLTVFFLIFETLLEFFLTVLLPEKMSLNSYFISDLSMIIVYTSLSTLLFKSRVFNWTSNLAVQLSLNAIFGIITTFFVFIKDSLFSCDTLEATLIITFAIQITALLAFYFIAKFLNSKISTIENSLTSEYLYILFFPSILQYFIFDFYYTYGSNEYLILFVLSVLATITVLITIYRQLKISEERTQNIVFTNLLKTSKEQMNQMIENEDSLKEVRHDLKNHLIVMQGLLKDEQYDQLETYLSNITPMFDIHQPRIYCQNIYLNTLLNHKVAEYREIDFDIQVYPSFCGYFSDVDLYILVSNLLDNAIQELTTHSSLDKTIHLSLEVKDAFQIIKISNPLSQEKTLKTEKKDVENHGLGLSIIRKIVKKYDGEMLIKQDNNFEVKILFCLSFPEK